VIDGRPEGAAVRSDRALALSHGARLILERLGVWTALAAIPGAATPIFAIDISQARGFGAVRLEAAEQGVPALGYVVSYRALQHALDDALAGAGIDVRFGAAADAIDGTPLSATIAVGADPEATLHARLAIVADGAASSVRGVERQRRDYGQVAVVATVGLDHAHRGVAYERFTPHGPVALLPEGDHYALVWTQSPEAARKTLALTDPASSSACRAFWQPRPRLTASASRSSPGRGSRSHQHDRRSSRRSAAGAGVHPIAGQGDPACATRLSWLRSSHTPRGTSAACACSRATGRTRRDRRAGIAFTRGLVHLSAPSLRGPRGPQHDAARRAADRQARVHARCCSAFSVLHRRASRSSPGSTR
jgi:2-octaprenyl-6-methoxyphenol hydroxylase